MFVKKLVDLEEFKKILESRGIIIEEIVHPKGLEEFIAKTKFRVMFDDEDEVSKWSGSGEVFEEVFELHNLNYLCLSRQLELFQIVHEDKDLFPSFVRDFVWCLRFKIKYVGEWVRPWGDGMKNKIDVFTMARNPKVQAFMRKK